jgi:hypothetical protein
MPWQKAAGATSKRSPAAIFQLKITLRESKPPIWRRIQVAGDTTLHKLHNLIMVIMQWSGGHLHEFTVGGVPYTDKEFEDLAQGGLFTNESKDGRRALLNKVAPTEGSRFSYLYDFGDSWEFVVQVEKILEPEAGVKYPRCVGGRRAAPVEDSGGVYGYYELLETLNGPDSPERTEMLEWLGEDVDPKDYDCTRFSVDEINERLAQLR